MRQISHVRPSAALHPFIFTSDWLEKIGYGTESDLYFCNGDFVSDLKILATIIRKDGKLNSKSPYAEKFAICLAQQGHDAEAIQLFLAIVDGKENVLLVHEPPELGRFQSSETADRPGFLGYIGVRQFAESALRQGKKDLAKSLFQEIVDRLAGSHSPLTLTDTRIHALEWLKELGVKELSSGASLAQELRKAREIQY